MQPKDVSVVDASAPVCSASTTPCSGDHINGLYIVMLFYTILNRDLDTAGYDFWLGVANSAGAGLLFQGAAGHPTRIQILGPDTARQGFIGSQRIPGIVCQLAGAWRPGQKLLPRLWLFLEPAADSTRSTICYSTIGILRHKIARQH